MELKEINMIEKLKELQNNAYAKYSDYPVSTIVITKDGKEFNGVNVEDATTRAGSCAERVALFSMIAAGYTKGDVKEINIMTKNGGTPCFVCRQMLIELCDMDTIINCYDINGILNTYTVKELCPYPFNEEDLK